MTPIRVVALSVRVRPFRATCDAQIRHVMGGGIYERNSSLRFVAWGSKRYRMVYDCYCVVSVSKYSRQYSIRVYGLASSLLRNFYIENLQSNILILRRI